MSRAATPAAGADDLAHAWTALWNGDLGRAEALLADDFRIHFGGGDDAAVAGDAVSGPVQLAAYIEDFRARRPGLRFSLDAPPIAGGPGFAIR